MYVTRPLSLYRRSPDLISSATPECPNTGYLVIQDEESTPTCCFGTCKDRTIRDLPFPQNKLLYVHHSSGKNSTSYGVYLIPVINKPLSSNQYYAIKRHGMHKGEAYVSAKEEDMTTCCFFCKCISDLGPRPLDPRDVYQQFEFSTHQSCSTVVFSAKSVAKDGHPPHFLGGRKWTMYSKTPRSFSLGEANGIDAALRARLPGFHFAVSQQASTPVVVGKWYCPFMFIKEKMQPKEQVKKSMFYQMTLEQRWERIFTCENETRQSGNNTVIMDVVIPTETVKIAGKDALRDDTNSSGNGGVVWFKSMYSSDQQLGVGLSSLIVERMVWEEERFGWVNRDGNQVRGVRTDEYREIGWWTKFGCYVLVESFVLRRNDGTLVLTYDFMHTNQLKIKWE